MNISLEDVVMLDPAGNTANFKSFHVQGRLVRYPMKKRKGKLVI
jgi:hypothetical protein